MTRGPSRRPLIGFLTVLGLLTAGLGVARATRPEADSAGKVPPARSVPVATAVVVCPGGPSDAPRGSTARTEVAVPPAPTGTPPTATGRLDVRELGGRRLAGLRRTGASVSVSRPPGAGPLVVRASGPLAPGLTGGSTVRVVAGSGRGLAAGGCVPPGQEFWFVGGGAAQGQHSRLSLTNVDDSPARVDVTLHGPVGELDAPAGRGVEVGPGRGVVLALDAMAPGTAGLGVHVAARQGRVAAALLDQQASGLRPRGLDWVPAAAAPARTIVVPGLLAGPGPRLLRVLAPGAAPASVAVRVVAGDGSFAPAGADRLEVPAGGWAEVELATAARGGAVAVVLSSDVPVTAGVLARTGAGPGRVGETAYSAAGPALDGPALVPGAGTGSGLPGELTVSAPRRGGTVRLTVLTPGGRAGRSVTLRVPAATTRIVALGRLPSPPAYAVVVTPTGDGGPLFAGWSLREAGRGGPMVTAMPLTPARFAVSAPPLWADVTAGLPAPAS